MVSATKSANMEEASSSLEIQFGHGRHGSNVRHYVPSPEQIAATAAEVRNRGFVDCNGKKHPPWSESETQKRTAGRIQCKALA